MSTLNFLKKVGTSCQRVKGTLKVLEHPECQEEDNVGLAPLGASFQDGGGHKKLLLASLVGK